MAHLSLAAISKANDLHNVMGMKRVTCVAAGYVEVPESAAGLDVAVGKPALELSDDD